jgi:drug/metabolite transporter (DMT)-like permease
VNNGFLLGAMAALVWGVTDILVVQWARRVGVLRTLLTVQGSGVLLLALLAVVLGEDLSLSGGQWVAIAALGALSFGAYLGFYRALELGPIAIVSPIASSNGAMIVILAVVVLGESLTAGQAIGITLVLTFIVLASVEPAAERLAGGSGIRLALAATVVFGLYLFFLTTLADELGWLLPILLTRAVAVTLVGALFAARPDGEKRPLGKLGLAACAGAGALDALGYLLFNRGAEIGEVAITSAAASSYPLIPILVGLLGYRERVAWYQLVGVAGVLVGMVVLSLG